MTRIMVTGGSGFIGSHLIKELESQGHETFNYDIVEGYDLLDGMQIERIFKEFQPEEVYHLGGSVQMKPAEDDPIEDIFLNYVGTWRILRNCEKYESKLLFTGTGATYGNCGSPQREDMLPDPASNYGISKYAAELLIRKWVKCNDLHATITRFSSVYGPRRNAGPVNMMLKNAKEKGWIRVDGPGHHTRDLVDVRDAVNGTILVMDKGLPGEVYNVGSGTETSVVEIAWIIHLLTHAKIRHIPTKYSRFDLARSCYDISKVCALGYKPLIELRQGIKELMSYY